MLNAETIYRKARRLDAAHLQEASDFIDFLLDKIGREQAPEKRAGETKRGLKALLLSMPAVGEDADFVRRRDFGRTETSWDT